MTNQLTKTSKKKPDVANNSWRRRITDSPPELDSEIRHLVSAFIENHQRRSPPQRSFIQKLLTVGQTKHG